MEVIVELLFGPIAPSFAFLIPSTAVPNSKGNPFFGRGKNTGAMEKFYDFRLKSPHVAGSA